MPAIAVNPPFPLFTDADGQPLDDAYIYIGTANQNPASNPIAVYWDEALTIPAAQPIRTNAGYAVRNGSPSRFYAGTNYSILVRDKNGSFVYTAADENLFSSVDSTFIQAGAGAVTRSVQDKLRESVSVKDFGAVGDGVTDDWAAIQAAINSGAKRIYVPAATYYLTKCLQFRSTITFEGEGGYQAGLSPSILQFSNTTCAIVLHGNKTTCDEYGYNQSAGAVALGEAGGAIIRNLTIRRGTGSDTTIDGITHGIRFRTRALVDSCFIAGFAGNGIHIQATAGSADPANEGNVNSWGVWNTRIQNCQDGIFVDGADVNVGLGLHLDCTSNQRYGIYDSSFLGCNWISCHCANNSVKDIFHDNLNARSTFVGQYIEGGGLTEFAQNALVLGGIKGTQTGGYFIIDGNANLNSVSSRDGIFAHSEISGRRVISWYNGTPTALRRVSYDLRFGESTNYMPIGSLYGRLSTANTYGNGIVGIETYTGAATTTVAITGVTKANPGVITTGSAHGFAANDRVVILSVGGMTQLNGSYFVNTIISPTQFTLKRMDGVAVDTTSFGSYTSGGTAGESDGYSTAVEARGNTKDFVPGADNVWALGASASRWSVVYAATGTINTSDAREKQQVNELTEAEHAVAKRLKGLIRTYRWNDAVEKKGDKARIHVGVIAQDVMAAFNTEGLDAGNYGILCFDSWPDEFDEDGNKTREAGNRYGVRYDQLFAFVIAGL